MNRRFKQLKNVTDCSVDPTLKIEGLRSDLWQNRRLSHQSEFQLTEIYSHSVRSDLRNQSLHFSHGAFHADHHRVTDETVADIEFVHSFDLSNWLDVAISQSVPHV